MKAYKIIAALLFLLLATSMTSTAYTPRDEGFVQVHVYAIAEDRDNIVIGNQVDFSLVIENLWNDTMSNITITQTFQTDVKLVSIFDKSVAEDGITAFTDLSVTDEMSGLELDFTYLNATAENFTANLDMTLLEDEFFAIDFVLNFTTTGSFDIGTPEITYFDHWGDEKSSVQALGTQVTVVEEDTEPRRQYIPVFSTADPDYMLLVGGLLAIFAVAIFGRLLHFKKPVEL